MREWWHEGSAGDERKAPWLHPAVVLYLDKLIQPDWRILEHGSGGSTIWFGERAASVISFEHDVEWASTLDAIISDNVSVLMDDPVHHGLLEHSFDLMFIDGMRDNRKHWAMQAQKLVRPGGVVVFDNVNRRDHRYPEARNHLRKQAVHFITFEINPPGHKFSVTEMYRLPGGDSNWI